MTTFTRLAAALIFSCLASTGHAATSSSNDLLFDIGTINGHRVYHADYAIWATDGGVFNLDGATVSSNWPWEGRAPLPGEDNYDLYGKSTFYVTAYSKTDAGSDFSSIDTYHVNWNTTTAFTFNVRNADLVVINADAFSDGTRAHVAGAFGAGITPAVPEPETYAMMLAGLGVTALAARRRRQAA